MATLPHGTWPSPIPASALTARQARIDEVRVDGESTYWLESRPWEKGRTALVRHDSPGSTDVLPEPWNCRSRVHEYGGGSYAVRDGLVVFCEFTTTRVLRLDPGETEPVPLTPEGEVRYGGLVLAGEQVNIFDPALGGDNAGFAVFGELVAGADVAEAIFAAPISPTAGEGVMQGQILDPMVTIVSARRVPAPAEPPKGCVVAGNGGEN